MKEATGEATSTVVTIILIAGILGAAAYILTSVMNKIKDRADEAADGVVAINI